MKLKGGLGPVLHQCQMSALLMIITASGRHSTMIKGMKINRNEPREYKYIVCKSSPLYLEQLCIKVRPSMEFPSISPFYFYVFIFCAFFVLLVCIQTVRIRIM